MSGIIGFQGRSGILGQIGAKVHLGTYVGDNTSSDTDTKWKNIVNNDFAFYEIEINNLHQSSDTQVLRLRYWLENGNLETGSHYQTTMEGRTISDSGTSGAFNTNSNNASSIELAAGVGNAGGEVFNASLKLTGINLGQDVAFTHVSGNLGFAEPNAKLAVGILAGRWDYNGKFYGFKIYGGQNFDRGTITVYGIKK